MNQALYSLFTALGVCLVGAGLAFQILYIENNQNDEINYLPHQVMSILTSSIVVSYLVFNLLFFRPWSSLFNIGISSFLLIVGLTLEIFFMQFNVTPVTQGFAYAFAGLNALIRLFILISIRCGSYTSSIPEVLRKFLDESSKVGMPSGEASKKLAADLKAQADQVSDIDPAQLWNKIQSMAGADFKKIPDPDLAKTIKDQIQKALGVPPRDPRGGRRR
jgi:hypothetical protein